MHVKSCAIALAAVCGLCLPVSAEDLVYFEEDGGFGMPRGLYNFDPTTGVSTLRATVDGTERFFGLEVQPGTGRVFATAVPQTPSTLWTIDIDTGQKTLIGPINNDTIADITFDPTTGVLYGINRNTPYRFYSIDPETGTPTLIGVSSDAARCGLVCSASGQLYGFSLDGALASVDKTTGAATVIGGGSLPSVVEDATFTASGELYITLFNGQIYRIDVNTGAPTLVGTTGMGAGLLGIIAEPGGEPPCYANCDQSTSPPVLNVNDFICFQAAFAAGDSYANCDNSTNPPVLNVNDFICFQSAFAAGCR